MPSGLQCHLLPLGHEGIAALLKFWQKSKRQQAAGKPSWLVSVKTQLHPLWQEPARGSRDLPLAEVAFGLAYWKLTNLFLTAPIPSPISK